MITLIDINGYEISIHIGVFIAISIYSIIKAAASGNRTRDISRPPERINFTDNTGDLDKIENGIQTDGSWKPPVG